MNTGATINHILKSNLKHTQTLNKNQLLNLFGYKSYEELAKVLYGTPDIYKYKKFYIKKKNGDKREIYAPRKKIKQIQKVLSSYLAHFLSKNQCSHGFVPGCSIKTNADPHARKKIIFNIDLKDFFGTIHFGRVRNMFINKPFSFDKSTSTILAQICCFDNKLPQGAPTSPIVSNIICHKLDRDLLALAKRNNCHYTRYADDITFSSRSKLSPALLNADVNTVGIGHELESIIEKNGFHINLSKTRTHRPNSRMEVTGLTVNRFVNINKHFRKRIEILLFIWSRHGYDAATEKLKSIYLKQLASGAIPKLERVLKGYLLFVRMICGKYSHLYNHLSVKFNELLIRDGLADRIGTLSIFEPNNLFVVEHELGIQGTAFVLHNVGIITNAHLLEHELPDGSKSKLSCGFKAFSWKQKPEIELVLKEKNTEIDVAIFSPPSEYSYLQENCCFYPSDKTVKIGDRVTVLGFPHYEYGMKPSRIETVVSSLKDDGSIVLQATIHGGLSGAPVVNKDGHVVGVARKRCFDDFGHNEAIPINRVLKIAKDTRIGQAL